MRVKIIIATLSLIGASTIPSSDDHDLTVMTYNVRTDWQQDGENNWQFRRETLIDRIKTSSPDLLGMQEVRPHQLLELKKKLGEQYMSYGVGRDDGQKSGEFSPIFYRAGRFEAIKAKTIWCSTTPDIPSKSWDSALPRIVTSLQLRDKQSDEMIYVINTHFDHVGSVTRRECAKLIIREIQELTINNIVVMGDFNFTVKSEPYQLLNGANLRADIKLEDSQTVTKNSIGPNYSFNGFDPNRREDSPIDMIFVSSNFTVANHLIDDKQYDGRYPSDHFPVIIRLSYK